MEQYSRGWRGAPAKGVGRVTGARVQISPAPPYMKINFRFGSFFVSKKGINNFYVKF